MIREAAKQYWKNSRRMLIAFSIIWLVLFAIVLSDTKANTHILLNTFHTPELDIFFQVITYLGTLIPLGIGIGVLLFNIRMGCFIVLAQVFAFIVTQPLKFLFAHKRPAVFFYDMNMDVPNAVDGISLNTAYNSFPSGHTSAVFAFSACLIVITPAKYRWLQLMWLISGWFVAYSRIYLSQHFAEDILFGSLIGMLSGFAAYLCLYRTSWGERPLFKCCKFCKR